MVSTLQSPLEFFHRPSAVAFFGWLETLLSSKPAGPAGKRGEVGEDFHRPIMLEEVVSLFEPVPGKVIFDGTLGGGGHSRALLEAGAMVIGGDQDPAALNFASSRLAGYGEQFRAVRGNFANIDSLLEEKVDGIFVDIGVSSRQLEDRERGFSFMKEGPLDMRMNPEAPVSAATLIANESEESLGRLFSELGDESAFRRIAKTICQAREEAPIVTTSQLANLIESVKPRTSGRHPATKVFQALRIAVNQELEALESLLEKAANFLNPGGVFAVMSFHSLEDRMVKQFFRRHSQAIIDRPEWPEPRPNPDYLFDLPARNQAITASAAEIDSNPRARSARLRAAVLV